MHTQLSNFDIHPVTGFLPSPDPLTQLPSSFIQWDELGAQLPALLSAGKARIYLANMPLLDVTRLESKGQLERAMLLLSTFASAYVWGETQPAPRLPRSLAAPLWKVAERVGRKPIIGHASYVLNNWRRIDPNGSIELGNLTMLQPFLNSSDEAWFALVTVEIEAKGAAILPQLLRAQEAVETHDIPTLKDALQKIEISIQQITHTLMRMYKKCNPHVFYHHIRPFLASWNAPGVIYEGVSDMPLMYAGGSASQSSLIPSLDAVLGVRHMGAVTNPFLLEMRHYMPPAHKRFIETLENGPNVRAFVHAHLSTDPYLAEQYNSCIDALSTFRKKHMEIAVRYIMMQSPEQDDNKGTGGASFTAFLGIARRETRDCRLTASTRPRSVEK